MKKVQFKNSVIFVVDRSGSMSHLTTQVAKSLNKQIATLASLDKQFNSVTRVTVVTFDDSIEVIVGDVEASKVRKISVNDIYARGSTALFDAVGFAINMAASEKDKETCYLINALTDGYNNISVKFTPDRLLKLIQEKQATDKWTFTFQLPPGHKNSFCNTFRIPEGNCREWEQSHAGFVDTAAATTSSLSNYYNHRSLGNTSIKSFYKPVDVDLSNVSKSTLNKELDKVTNQFSLFDVTKEEQIRPFVERKTKQSYVKGSVYYQLSKKEKVQPQKQVLVRDKKTGTIWSGQTARDLIGLPNNQYAKVDPVNLSAYDVFIQSTSVNRILVRGTKIAVQK